MNPRQHGSIATVLALALTGWVAGAQADPSNKWRVKLDHTAQSNGAIVLRLAPVGGTAVDVETKIPSGTRENRAADLLRDSLRATLADAYHVETDDGEDVLIKKRGKTPDFDLTLVSSSVTGLQIEIERE